ncbi:Calx-beta domain-containing protein [Prosthecobacter sp.]|uniref:Calx-beta domain-containing protein n=1 Tax=Prosthecobacter sp. TaxID=1965333 RepID=UPI001DA29202|nr:Calx-beta domain-containing protein [Prosthecobacter sp.]MCB1274991.1 PKD domain-containing protein [Prosthecobacter sp.]
MRFRLLLAFAAAISLFLLFRPAPQERLQATVVTQRTDHRGTGSRQSTEQTPPTGPSIMAGREIQKVPTTPVNDLMASFDAWTEEYLKADAAGKAALIEEGVKLAAARRPLFKQLIKDDPRSALARAVPMVVRQKLPAEVLALLETRINQRAVVSTYQGVPAEGDSLPLPGQTLTHRIAQTKGDGAFNLHVFGRRAEIVVTVPNAAINGVGIDREIAASESPVRVLEVGEVPDSTKKQVAVCPVSGLKTASEDQIAEPITAEQAETVIETPEEVIHLCGGYHKPIVEEQYIQGEGTTGGPVLLTGVLPAPPTPAVGQLKVLYIPMTFQDQNDRLPTESKSYEIMRNVADYYSKSSFGKLTTQTTVTPHVKLSKNEAWYVQRDTSNGGDIDGLSLEMAHAREEARKLGFDYNDYDVTVLRLIGGARATGGWGGGGNVWVYGDSVGVTAHEIGHTFGLAHANFWDTAGTSAIGPGANAEYGDSYDVMGGGGVPNDHYNAAAKVQVKWLPQSYVQSVTTSGLYRVYAFDQPVLDPRNRYAMTITKDSQRTYWGEVRQLYNGSASRPWADKGIILGWKYPSGSGSNIQLIDTTPGSPYNKDDAAIALGQTFGDTEAGIFMTTIGVSTTTPKYVDVLINMGDFSGNTPPTLSLAASANVVPKNATVTFTATAEDLDGDTLAYQWQHWGDTAVKIVSPNSPVITRTFSTEGSYVVSCTVSDMKGGSITRTTLITVGNGGGKYTISGRVTAGGVGLPGVLLTANGTNPTITDSEGWYTIANLAANTYSVTPLLYGYSFGELFNNSITVAPNFAGADFEAEGLPMVSLTAIDASATEDAAGETATFRLTRTGDTAVPLTVNINPAIGTAAVADYTLAPALITGTGGFSTFIILADSSTLDVVLTPNTDTAVEGPETVKFALAAGSGYLVAPNAGSAQVVIEDNDTVLPKVSILATTDTVDEGVAAPGVFTVSRTGSTAADLTVSYSVGGSAVAGADYATLSGSVLIPAGSSSAVVNVTPLQDTQVEPLETVTLTLSANAGYVLEPTATTATVSLFDDDTNVVTLSVTDATAQEVDLSVPGSVADTGTFLVTRSGDLSASLTVYYSVAGSPSTGVPAIHGVDYEALPGAVQIPAGSKSAAITIVPRWDGFGETAEQVLLQLGAGPTDYRLGDTTSGTVTINDSAASNAPYVEVAGQTSAVEGGTSGVIRFSIKGSIAGTVSVPFSLDGTAVRTTDYTVTLPSSPAGSTFDAASGTGVIVMNSSGSTASTVDLTFVPVNDTDLEDIESIICTITSSPSISTYAPTSSASIWLRDNDQPTVWVDSQVGTSALTINRIVEGATTSPFKFYASRTGSTTSALTLNFSLQGTATPGTDYNVTTSGTLTFNNGTRTGTLTIPATASGADVTLNLTGTNDTDIEGTETIILHLEAGSYSRTPDATIYLDDNDTTTQTVAFASNGSSGAESVATVNVPVTLASPSVGITTVDYYVDSGARASVTGTTTVPTLPYWTRVVRADNVLTSYVSSDGEHWQMVSTPQTISLVTNGYTVGLVAMSSSSGVSCTATLDNFSITGLDAGGAASASTFGSIGTTNPASSSSESGGVFTLNAGGAGLSTSSTSDTSCYVSHVITNSTNCIVTARVVSIANGNNTSRAGVTIRDSTATTSKHMAMLAEKAGTARTIRRISTSASSATTTIVRPYWVRLQRVGSVFSAWASPDGGTWTQTSTDQTIPMGIDVQAGLAVSSRSNGTLSTAIFDNVTINNVPASGLTGRTIGFVNAQGSDSLDAGTYTVSGSGAAIGGTGDACHFVATTLTGDFNLVARVISQTGGATTAQAGVMVRDNHGYRAMSAYHGVVANARTEFIYRNSTVTNAFGTGVDFSLANGTLTFNNNEQTKDIVLNITDDTIPEPNESVTIFLRNPTAAMLGSQTYFTYVINDDDTPPVLPLVGFAQTSSSAVEAAAGTQEIAVSLSAPADSAISVDFTVGGTATSGSDFTLSAGTVTFAPGETVQTIPLVIYDDAVVESNETVVLTLTNPVGAAIDTQDTHTFTITDDDLPVVSIVATDASASETGPDPGVFTISRTGATTADLVVSLTRSGTAANNTDYASISTTSTFNFSIPIGQSSATITISPLNDSTNEVTETVILTVNSSAGVYTVGSPSAATVTLLDNDRSTVTIAATDGIASESAGNTGTFTITRTAPTTGTLSVAFTVTGTALSGSDYAALTSPFTFSAGEVSRTFTITPVDDLLTEGDETVLMQLSSGSYDIGGDGYDEVAIQDNDFPPVVSIVSPTSDGNLVASGQGIIVSATATDDGSPAALSTTWSQVSGPGTATFAAPSALSSAVTFSADGVYVLQFSATDTQFTVGTQVTVIVGADIAAEEWIAQDMSPTTKQRGQTAKVGFSLLLTGMGAGYTGTTTDAAHIMARQVTGNGSIMARITSLSGPAATPLAGVTIRDSLNRSVRRAVLGYSNGTLQLRMRTSVSTNDTAVTQSGITLPVWVKLERDSASQQITGSYASDSGGTPGSWTVIGSPTVVSMLNDVTVMGLTATGNSATAGQLCTAAFDNVTLTPAPSGPALLTENFGTSPSTQATFAFDGTTYTIGAADSMDGNGAFYGWQYQGDLMVTAKLVDANSGALNAKSGIMIRESMDNGGYSHVGRIPTGSFNGYIWRSVAAGATGGVPSFTGKIRWMRLIREGNRITAFHAADSGGAPGTWTQLGSPRTIIMTPRVFVGFAVDNAGGTAGVLNVAKFSNLTVVPLNRAPNILLASVGDISPVSLDATVSDDSFPLPVSLTTNWSQTGGPSSLVFGNPSAIDTTAALMLNGIHTVRLTADDSAISSFRDLSVTAYTSPFAKWLVTTSTGDGDNSLAEASADSDGDGLVNLLEYAVGTNGAIQNGSPQVVTLSPVSSERYLRIAIPKNPDATDVIFTVQATSDISQPASWSSAGLIIELDTSSQLIVRDSVPVSSGQPRFMRVKVERQ